MPDPLPIRLAVQIVLSTATWHYYYATGHTCFNKHLIAERLCDEVLNYRFQQCVDCAAGIRTSGFVDDSDEAMASMGQCARLFLEWSETEPPSSVPIGVG